MSIENFALLFIIPLTFLAFYGIWKNSPLTIGSLFLIGAFGQLGRLFVTESSIGVLSLDFIVPILVSYWLVKNILSRNILPKSFLGSYILLFLGVMLCSFILIFPSLPLGELLGSFSYFFRLVSYVGLFFMSKEVLQTEQAQKKIMPYLYLAGGLLILGGIIQFIFVPDFTFMAYKGWDPHIGRLLGTWYDPNYIGGFFAFIVAFILGYLFNREKKRLPILHILLLIGLLAGILLTYSRSALLALLIVLGVVGILRARVFVLCVLLLGTIAISTNDRLQERTQGLIDGILATTTGSGDYMLDVTSQKRVESWNEAATIINGNWLFGVGYNTITYRKLDKGLIADTTKHSASGTDASLLNVLLTTGIVGVAVYTLLLIAMLFMLWKLFWSSNNKSIQGYALGGIAGLLGIFGHSFFVNTLFFPLFLVYFFPILALFDTWYMEQFYNRLDTRVINIPNIT